MSDISFELSPSNDFVVFGVFSVELSVLELLAHRSYYDHPLSIVCRP